MKKELLALAMVAFVSGCAAPVAVECKKDDAQCIEAVEKQKAEDAAWDNEELGE